MLVNTKKRYYFSWQLTSPDRFGNMSLYNAGGSEALNVEIEPANGARIEPRRWFQARIPAGGISDRFKVARAGAAKYPSIRVMWKDQERQPYSIILEVKI